MLGLTDGMRRSVTRPNGSKAWFSYYKSAISCLSGTSIQAEIRNYSPPNDTLYPDDTVVFVIAKAAFCNGTSFLLDIIHMLPFGGDPRSDSYEAGIPNFTCPYVLALGTVIAHGPTNVEGVRSFTLSSTEYVRDRAQAFTLRCASRTDKVSSRTDFFPPVVFSIPPSHGGETSLHLTCTLSHTCTVSAVLMNTTPSESKLTVSR